MRIIVVIFMLLGCNLFAQEAIQLDQLKESPEPNMFPLTENGTIWPISGIQVYQKFKDHHFIDTFYFKAPDSLCISFNGDSLPDLCTYIPPGGGGPSDTSYYWLLQVNGGADDTIGLGERINLSAGTGITITGGTDNPTINAIIQPDTVCLHTLTQLTDSTAQLTDCNGNNRGTVTFSGTGGGGDPCLQDLLVINDTTIVLTDCDGVSKDTVIFRGGGGSSYDTYVDSAFYASDTLTFYRKDTSGVIDSFKVEVVSFNDTIYQQLSQSVDGLIDTIFLEEGGFVVLHDSVGGDHDWYTLGTTEAPQDITDVIYTYNNVRIGTVDTVPSTYWRLGVEANYDGILELRNSDANLVRQRYTGPTEYWEWKMEDDKFYLGNRGLSTYIQADTGYTDAENDAIIYMHNTGHIEFGNYGVGGPTSGPSAQPLHSVLGVTNGGHVIQTTIDGLQAPDSITAYNGLTNQTPDSIKLGGTLVETTVIDGDANSYRFYFDSLARYYVDASEEIEMALQEIDFGGSFDTLSSRFIMRRLIGQWEMDNTGQDVHAHVRLTPYGVGMISQKISESTDHYAAIELDIEGLQLRPFNETPAEGDILTARSDAAYVTYQNPKTDLKLYDYDFVHLYQDSVRSDTIDLYRPTDSTSLEKLVWREGATRIGTPNIQGPYSGDNTTLTADTAAIQIFNKRSALDIYADEPYMYLRNPEADYYHRVTEKDTLQRYDIGVVALYDTSLINEAPGYDTVRRSVFTIDSDADSMSLNIKNNYLNSKIYLSSRNDSVRVDKLLGLMTTDSVGNIVMVSLDTLNEKLSVVAGNPDIEFFGLKDDSLGLYLAGGSDTSFTALPQGVDTFFVNEDSLFINDEYVLLPQGADSLGVVLPTGQVLHSNGTRGPEGSDSLFFVGNELGIGTASPSANLHILDEGNAFLKLDRGSGNYTEFRQTATQLRINNNVSSGNAVVDINPSPSGSSNATFRFFRETNTTGSAFFDIFLGDGSGTTNARIAGKGQDSYVAANNGEFGVGVSNPQQKFHVNGTVRLENLGTIGATVGALIYDSDGDIAQRTLADFAGDISGSLNFMPMSSLSTNHIPFWDGSALATDFSDLVWNPDALGAGVGGMALMTATPTHTLTVAGDGYFTGFLELDGGIKDAGGSLGTSGQILQSTGGDVQWTNNTAYTLPALSTNHIVFYDGTNLSTDFADLYWNPDSVRLGLNTNSPTHTITVAGTGRLTGAIQLDGGIKDGAASIGSNGQVLKSDGVDDVIWGTDAVNDADANPTNEAQTLSKSGDNVTLTEVGGVGGGSFSLAGYGADGNGIYSGGGTVGGGTTTTVAINNGTLLNFDYNAGADELVIGNNVIANTSFYAGANTTNQVQLSSAAGYAQINHETLSATRYLRFEDDGDVLLNSANSGFVIRNSGHTFLLAATGGVGVNALNGSYTFFVSGSAAKSSGGTLWVDTSDKRLKRDIHNIDDPYEKIMALRPVAFRYKEEYIKETDRVDRQKYGFIAQEYQKIFPEDVTTGIDGILGLAPEAVMPHNTAAIQQLIRDNQELRQRIEKLEKLIK